MRRHLIRLERCPLPSSLLAALPLPDGRSVALSSDLSFEELPIVHLAQLSVKTELDGALRLHTSRLEAQLCRPLALPETPVLYRLTDVEGRRLLLGLPDAPYPLTLVEDEISSSPSASSPFRLAVTWSSIYPPLLILDPL